MTDSDERPTAPDAASLKAQLAQATAERDRYAVMLLVAEQEIAVLRNVREQEFPQLVELRRAYSVVVNSNSWKITQPLRRIGRLKAKSE